MNYTKLEDLKTNPIFQLSLSSKELFHSNFLYWLATTEELIPIFCNTINDLLSQNNPLFRKQNDTWEIKDGANFIPFVKKCVVLREYNNFDLCICKIKESLEKNEDQEEEQPSKNKDKQNSSLDEIDKEKAGKVLFVLENKFKSICTYQQLDKYNKKIIELNLPYYKQEILNGKRLPKDQTYGLQEKFNNIGLPKCLLLSLAKDFSEKDKISKLKEKIYPTKIGRSNKSDVEIQIKNLEWAITSYDELALKLSEQLSNIQNIAGKIILNNNALTIGLNSLGLNHLIINSYIDFISFFADQTQARLQEINKCSKLSDIFESKDFESIRCADIWQKIALHKVVQLILEDSRIKEYEIDFDGSLDHIKEDAASNKKDKIYINVDLLHAQGLLSVKKFLKEDYCLEIELHGGNLCLGVDFFPGCRNNYVNNRPPKKEEKREWEHDIVNVILDPLMKLLPDSAPFEKKTKVYAYQNKDGSGYYYHVYDHKQNRNSVCLALTIEKIIRWIIDKNVNRFEINKK